MIIMNFNKQPHEEFYLEFDFTVHLFGGTVTSATTLLREEETGTDRTATLLTGSTTTASPIVTSKTFVGGTSGLTYIMEVLATMSGGPKIEAEVRFIVQED